MPWCLIVDGPGGAREATQWRSRDASPGIETDDARANPVQLEERLVPRVW